MKIIEEKGHMPKQVLMQMKMSYSGKKYHKRYSKEEKQAPRFKAGRG